MRLELKKEKDYKWETEIRAERKNEWKHMSNREDCGAKKKEKGYIYIYIYIYIVNLLYIYKLPVFNAKSRLVASIGILARIQSSSECLYVCLSSKSVTIVSTNNWPLETLTGEMIYETPLFLLFPLEVDERLRQNNHVWLFCNRSQLSKKQHKSRTFPR